MESTLLAYAVMKDPDEAGGSGQRCPLMAVFSCILIGDATKAAENTACRNAHRHEATVGLVGKSFLDELGTTPDKASWPAKWDEQHKVHVPFCYLGANGTTVWSVRKAASIWIRCEGCDAPCAVSLARPIVGAGVVGVGGSAGSGDSSVGVVAHGSLTTCTAVVYVEQGGSVLT